MPRDFYPRREADIVKWSSNFSSRIIADPQRFALTPGQAAAYAERAAAFATAYRAANTRKADTNATVTKEFARVILEAETRKLANIIRPSKVVSVDDKLKLGLRLLTGRKHRIERPSVPPGLEILSVDGRTVMVQLVDREHAKHARAVGADGAVVMSFVGAEPPTDPADWRFERNTTTARFELTFRGEIPPGATVWLTAYWYNPRRETGPSCEPVSTNIRTGVVMNDDGMRITPASWAAVRKAA